MIHSPLFCDLSDIRIKNRYELSELLVDFGADINRVDTGYFDSDVFDYEHRVESKSIYHKLKNRGPVGQLKLLLNNPNFAINQPDSQGFPLICVAADNLWYDCIKLLIEAGAD